MNQSKLTNSETKYLRILAKKHLLLPTKHKKPLVTGWNTFYAEKKTIEQLLALNNEYSLRTGTKISDYYFLAIDLDDIWAKERINDTRYIETNKGIHRYLLIKELPKSCYLVNKDGKRIGELHSKGRFIVGIGSIHERGTRYTLKGRNNLPWSLKMENLTELQEFLTTRNIFTTPWGKTGKENIQSLKLFTVKLKKTFQQKKENLENLTKASKQPLHICYICLISLKKDPETIESHIHSKNHLEKLTKYQNKKLFKNGYSSHYRILGQE